MSDLTTLDAIKKAAERARAKAEERAHRLRNDPVKHNAALMDIGSFSFFIEELGAAMKNPRDD